MSEQDKWVTLAIRTYQRAQRIKEVMDQHEIETMIHNLNLENPEIAVGVRVRIREKDLPQALKIVEEMEKAWDEEAQKDQPPKGRNVLVPIELTDQIHEVCNYGFYFADKLNADIVFLHAYLTPAYTITSSSTTEINTYSLTDTETIRRQMKTNSADVENLTRLIQRRIKDGELPNIKFSFRLVEGVAEDEILNFCKREEPSMVVMGTRSRHKTGGNLIGSVTAEVLEACRVPVMAIPSGLELMPDRIQRIAFFTGFDQKDLIAIDTLISFFGKENIELMFIHATDKQDSWDEIMLAGIKEYFAGQYEGMKTEYSIIDKNRGLEQIQPFLEESKIDLVGLHTRRRSLFARIFNQGIATKLLFNVDTPLMVLHV